MIHVKQELFEKYSEDVLFVFVCFFFLKTERKYNKKNFLLVIKLFYDKENFISHEFLNTQL